METGMITVEIELDEELMRRVEAVLRSYSITIEQAVVLFLEWCVENPELAGRELLRWKRLQEEVGQDVC